MSKGINHTCTPTGDGEYLTTYTRTRQGKRNVTVNRRVGPRAARRWCKTHGVTFRTPDMPTAQVKDFDGNLVTVTIGDWVGFKSDHEQSGQIVKITRTRHEGNVELHLHDENGFGGEYLRYSKDTVEMAGDCWV